MNAILKAVEDTINLKENQLKEMKGSLTYYVTEIEKVECEIKQLVYEKDMLFNPPPQSVNNDACLAPHRILNKRDSYEKRVSEIGAIEKDICQLSNEQADYWAKYEEQISNLRQKRETILNELPKHY